MPTLILLDAGPLGLVTNPKASPAALACNLWLERLLANDVWVVVPEIADYEVRRELIRANKMRGLHRLSELTAALSYAAITTPIMRRAARLWAEARQQGQPTADPMALDADVILAATAQDIYDTTAHVRREAGILEEQRVFVATTNVGHLSRFVEALEWQAIDPEVL